MSRRHKQTLIVLGAMAYAMLFAMWLFEPKPMAYPKWLHANCPRILASPIPFGHPQRLECNAYLRDYVARKEAR